MNYILAKTHPFLFLIVALLAIAELGLTVYLISYGNANDYFVSSRYHALLITFCTLSSWTTLFAGGYVLWILYGGAHALAGVASSLIWLLVTTAAWSIATGILNWARIGGQCPGRPAIHKCRESLTVMALGYAELSVCSCILLFTAVQSFLEWRRGNAWFPLGKVTAQTPSP